MRQLRQGSAGQLLRIEFPRSWDPASLSGVTLSINDREGNELLSAQDVDIWAASAVDGTIDPFSNSFTLDDPDDALVPGDCIYIDGASGPEVKTVKGYDATSMICSVDSIFSVGHSDGDAVYARWGTIEIDISDTALFPAGSELVFIWTPEGTGAPLTETGFISEYSQVQIPGFDQKLRSVFHRAYVALSSKPGRLEDVKESAVELVSNRLIERDVKFNINNMRDIGEAKMSVAIACAYYWTLGADEDLSDESARYLKELDREINGLCARPIWIDSNANKIQDDGEAITRRPVFHKGW